MTRYILFILAACFLNGCYHVREQVQFGCITSEYSPQPARGLYYDAEQYDPAAYNREERPTETGGHTSTFSLDVDTASYTNIRRMLLQQERTPPAGAVRVEEMVNYFQYEQEQTPTATEHPFDASTELAPCPWNPQKKLLRICVQSKTIEAQQRPPSNLVFLIDVSGSMDSPDKLGLVKHGLEMLSNNLDKRDRVSIVVYAGTSGLVLDGAKGSRDRDIRRALRKLSAGGSTNGGQGIQLAYHTARRHYIAGGNNRVILCTDGDFNVGVTDREALNRLIKKEASTGVQLTVLGFGSGNYNDATMEDISNKGDGNYYTIDTKNEAKKVLCENITRTLVTIAKDVKAQAFFNPRVVKSWRLVGYENRILEHEDFNNDRKDAADLGAGDCVTILYELALREDEATTTIDHNPYANSDMQSTQRQYPNDVIMTLRFRYKNPGAPASILQEMKVGTYCAKLQRSSNDFRWSASVAWFGMLLKGSPYTNGTTIGDVLRLARTARNAGNLQERDEFMTMMKHAEQQKRYLYD